ncbi:peptidylprolyl isomerase [Sphingomonas sp. MMS24-JH45]
MRLQTAAGPIVLALDQRHAPITTANFLRYVDDGRFDGSASTAPRATRGRRNMASSNRASATAPACRSPDHPDESTRKTGSGIST